MGVEEAELERKRLRVGRPAKEGEVAVVGDRGVPNGGEGVHTVRSRSR